MELFLVLICCLDENKSFFNKNAIQRLKTINMNKISQDLQQAGKHLYKLNSFKTSNHNYIRLSILLFF